MAKKQTKKEMALIKYNQLMELFKTCPQEEWDDFVKTIESQRPKKPTTYKAPLNVGVGAYIKGLITEGYANKDILALVKVKYQNNNTTYACVAWYRNDMIKKGLFKKAA
jgi:hypothetical protein